MWEILSGIGGLLANFATVYEVFTDKKLLDVIQRKFHVGTKRLMLTTEDMSQLVKEDQIRLRKLAFGGHIDETDWNSAITAIRSKHRALSMEQKCVLIVSDHYVNLCALFMFGWFFDTRSGFKIIFCRNENGRTKQYTLESNPVPSTMPLLEDRCDLAYPKRGYKAIAIYVGCTSSHHEGNIAPFDHFVSAKEKELGADSVYKMRFVKQTLLTPEDDLVGAGVQIDAALRKIRNVEYCDSPGVPVYLCMNVSAPMAMAIGTRLGVYGNLCLCTYHGDTGAYQESIMLKMAMKSGDALIENEGKLGE